jgi:hypothetical protein
LRRHRSRAAPSGISVGLGIALSLASPSARAQMSKDQCVDSNTQAQHLRSDGKLSQAREQLLRCADPACPALVRSDCTKRLDDLDTVQPTIAFEAKDASGADLVAVKVTMDGKLLTDRLDGTALAVDPGPHTFAFETTGPPSPSPPVTLTLVLTEGEKGRRERVVLGAAEAPVPVPSRVTADATPAAAEPEAIRTSGRMRTRQIVGGVAGGVGAAGLVVGGVFGALTLSEKSQQEDACRSPCSPASHAQALNDHSAGMTDSTIATVAFIAGGALVLGGAVLFFTARSASEPHASTALTLAPSVGPGGGGMWLRGEF